MILTLQRNDLLRLERARGLTIEVVRGRVWMTEGGRSADTFLAPGQPFRITRNELVLLGPGQGAPRETALRLLFEPMKSRLTDLFAHLLQEWQVRRTLHLLWHLDDSMLKDLGLRRGSLEASVRDRLSA
jgi:uncharacterized protein YjiS (DUF1127 family)